MELETGVIINLLKNDPNYVYNTKHYLNPIMVFLVTISAEGEVISCKTIYHFEDSVTDYTKSLINKHFRGKISRHAGLPVPYSFLLFVNSTVRVK